VEIWSVGLLELAADRAEVVDEHLDADGVGILVTLVGDGGIPRLERGGAGSGETLADEDAVAEHVARAGAGGLDRGHDRECHDGDDRENDDDDAALQEHLGAAVLLALVVAEHLCFFARDFASLVFALAIAARHAVRH
jgi:hypothetical protein